MQKPQQCRTTVFPVADDDLDVAFDRFLRARQGRHADYMLPPVPETCTVEAQQRLRGCTLRDDDRKEAMGARIKSLEVEVCC